MKEIIKTWSGAGGFSFTTEKTPNKTFTLSQMTTVDDYFEQFLIKEKFDEIVEIGTYKGGLCILFDEIKQKHNLQSNITTFDVSIWDQTDFSMVLGEFQSRNIAFHQTDGCGDDGMQIIRSKIKKGKTLLLCDALKIREVNYYAPYLKTGDIIMAHDYSHDGRNYGWSWIEITYADIKTAMEINNYVPYTDINFQNVAWACFKKL